MLRVCIHAQHLAFIRAGARRRASRIGAANLNAGAGGGAARRRNDFENHDGNEIDDNHLRYEQPRCRQLGNPAAPADDHNGNETTNTTATVDKSVIRQIVDEQLREAANEQTTTNKQEDTGTEEIKEDSTPKNLRWLGIIAICATVIMGCFFVLRFVGRK